MARSAGKNNVSFSFFKKKPTDSGVDSSNPDTVTPQHSQAQTKEKSDFDRGSDPYSGIEVSMGDSLLSPAEEQAAILFANGANQAVAPILQAELKEIRGKRHLETWLMLFELYQQTGDRAGHEILGLEFVLEFEKTPPIWLQRKVINAQKKIDAGNTCVFGAALTAATHDAELRVFRATAARMESLRLDFSRVREIDSMAAAEILAIWQISRKMASPRQILGADTFGQLLQEKIETGRRIPAEAPFWLLLIELYQAIGLQEEFENLAVDYAITFEVSPPSWDKRLAPPKTDTPSPAPEPGTAEKSSQEGLSLQGDISSEHPQSLAEIRDYAQNTSGELVLNFEDVDRVDFESAGQFLNLFMEFLQKGRSVRIIQVNALVFALLRLMGITDLISIERRKV